MKIAMVIENFDPTGGGAERNVAETSLRLSQRGHDVTVLAAWSQNVEAWGGGGGGGGGATGSDLRCELVIGPGKSSGRKLKSARRLHRFVSWAESRLAEGGYDVTLSVTPAVRAMVMQPLGGTYRETLERNRIAQPTAIGQWVRRVGCMVRKYAGGGKRGALLALEEQTYADDRVRAIAALSRYVAWQLMHHYAIDAEKITVIANAVDASRLTVSSDARLATRAVHAIADDEIAYLFSAFNPRLKGFNSLLQATARVRQQGVRAVILAVGRYRHAERAMIRQAGLIDAVRVVGVTQDVASMYAAADVTVVPTFYDTGSRVVIESLLAGRPVIATRQCGADEWIESVSDDSDDSDVGEDGESSDSSVVEQSNSLGQAGTDIDPAKIKVRRGRVISDARDIDGLTQAMIELADRRTRQDSVCDIARLAEEVSIDRHVDQLEALLVGVADSVGRA